MSRLLATAPAPVPELMEVLNAVIERRQNLEKNAVSNPDPADTTIAKIAMLHIHEWRLRLVLDIMPPEVPSIETFATAAENRERARHDVEDDAPFGAGDAYGAQIGRG